MQRTITILISTIVYFSIMTSCATAQAPEKAEVGVAEPANEIPMCERNGDCDKEAEPEPLDDVR